jgi:hypothetical protein
MRAAATFANAGWAAASLPAWRRFRRALRHPADAQWRRLRALLAANAGTAYGRAHGFATIRSFDDYRARVPVVTYDALEPWVRRIAQGEARVLTAEPVERLVPSSGSTAAVKLVPYTRSLRRELAGGVGAWVAEIYRRRPSLMAGRAYWSITPAAGAPRPFAPGNNLEGDAVLSVGFDSDAAYLGGVRGALAARALAVPPSVALEHDLTAFHRKTLIYLVAASDLRVISVWHPSFLAGLLDALIAEWPRLVDDLGRRDTRRATALRRADPARPRTIWPHLGLVSCWADGPARAHADALAARLPGVALQPKGLLATEGIVTLPFAGRHPLAVTSHVFEFIDDDGRPRLANELRTGREYSVVMTTGGGLWRYHLADRVRVDGAVDATPSLRFVGRDDRVSDRFGEKLSDGFVAGVLDAVFAGRAQPGFAMLAPDDDESGRRAGYALYVECDEASMADLAPVLERELRRNPHYAWCVDLGQLRPARVVRVGRDAARLYVDRCLARGQKLGDIKPASLHPASGWGQALRRPR